MKDVDRTAVIIMTLIFVIGAVVTWQVGDIGFGTFPGRLRLTTYVVGVVVLALHAAWRKWRQGNRAAQR